ncbi:MAG: hypothetical protein LBR67_01290 [Dysgonamonadaceae bacterium]|jgi:hypothetical protein|nr:hypothetical protein [Dysgonamonadaceae bacterium]
MKRNMKSFAFAAIALFGLFACQEDIPERDLTINQGNPAFQPTVELKDASDVTYEGAVLSLALTLTAQTDSVMEAGFLIADNEAFHPVSKIITFKKPSGGELGNQLTSLLTGLPEKTQYYVKAFAATKYSGTAYSNNVISFTTGEAPQFEDTYLFGTYSAIDIDLTTGEQEGGAYPITIKQVGQLYNRISIYNVWGAEETIEATVDFSAKTITTDVKSVIYVDPDYGICWMQGFDIVGGAAVNYPTAVAIADYNATGKIQFRYWKAQVSAGYFGLYLTILTKQ